MKPMDFMNALGKVDGRYVEEMLDAKDGGARRKGIRFDPLPAIGVMSGLAVCAAMVFGIMAVKNPGQTLKPQDVGVSGEPVENWENDPENTFPLLFEIPTESVTDTGVILRINNLSDTTKDYRMTWYLSDEEHNQLTQSMPLNVTAEPGVWAEFPLDLSAAEHYAETSGKYKIRLECKEGTAHMTAYVPFNYVADDVPNAFDIEVLQDTVTDYSVDILIEPWKEKDEEYDMQWCLTDSGGTPISALHPITVLGDAAEPQIFTLNWAADDDLTMEKGLTYQVLMIRGSSLGEEAYSFGTFPFVYTPNEADDNSGDITVTDDITETTVTTVITTTATADTTTAASTSEFVIHFPNDPVETDVTTPDDPVQTSPIPPDYNDGKVRVIAAFREQMERNPAELTEQESENIKNLIGALGLTPVPKSYGDAHMQEMTGGPYYIYANNKRYDLYDEQWIFFDGNYYLMTEESGKALLDEVIRMVTKFQP